MQDKLAWPSKAAEQAPAQGSSEVCTLPNTHTHAHRGKDFPSSTRRAGQEGLGDRGRGMMTAGQRTKVHKPSLPEGTALLPKRTALWAILTERPALPPKQATFLLDGQCGTTLYSTLHGTLNTTGSPSTHRHFLAGWARGAPDGVPSVAQGVDLRRQLTLGSQGVCRPGAVSVPVWGARRMRG